MAPRALIAALLAGCATDPLVSVATTDGGSYVVELRDDVYASGLAEVVVAVTDANTGAPASGLAVAVAASMPDMHQDFPAVVLSDGGDGTYTGRVGLGMAGIWEIDGEVDAEGVSEGFLLRVAVE